MAKGFFNNTTYFGFLLRSPNDLHIQSWGSKVPCREAERMMLFTIIRTAEHVYDALGDKTKPLNVVIDGLPVDPLDYFFEHFEGPSIFVQNTVVDLDYAFVSLDKKFPTIPVIHPSTKRVVFYFKGSKENAPTMDKILHLYNKFTREGEPKWVKHANGYARSFKAFCLLKFFNDAFLKELQKMDHVTPEELDHVQSEYIWDNGL